MARDSRAEARKAWRQMGKHKSMFRGWMLRADYDRAATGIIDILESLARREYEEGFKAGVIAVKEFPREWGVTVAQVQTRRRG